MLRCAHALRDSIVCSQLLSHTLLALAQFSAPVADVCVCVCVCVCVREHARVAAIINEAVSLSDQAS